MNCAWKIFEKFLEFGNLISHKNVYWLLKNWAEITLIFSFHQPVWVLLDRQKRSEYEGINYLWLPIHGWPTLNNSHLYITTAEYPDQVDHGHQDNYPWNHPLQIGQLFIHACVELILNTDFKSLYICQQYSLWPHWMLYSPL